MRKIFYYILIITISISCGKNEYEKKLVGKWYAVDELQKFEFSRDSLKISFLPTKTKWKATKDSIKFNVKDFFSDTIHKTALKYQFKQDTLLLTPNNHHEDQEDHEDREDNNHIKFVKADNFLDFLFSKNKVSIELPTNYNVKHINADARYGMKIFLESRKDSIYAKTAYSNNLNNLQSDFKAHIAKFAYEIHNFMRQLQHIRSDLNEEQLKDLWIKKHIHFLIFADNKISKKEIRPFYNQLKEIEQVQKAFYIYDIDESKSVSFYLPKGVECE